MFQRRSKLTVATLCVLLPATLLSAADDKDKDKDKIEWVQVMTTKGGEGGKSTFKVSEDTKVKFAWEVQPTSGSTSFRITLSKQHERTGNYQTIGTIFKTNSRSQKHIIANLKQGNYQIYLAVRRMNYTVTVYTAKK